VNRQGNAREFHIVWRVVHPVCGPHYFLHLCLFVQVLNAVLNQLNGKYNCFEDSSEAFCGNRIVEANEQCDCGFGQDCEEHGDTCCYPRGNHNKSCQRKEHAKCRLVIIIIITSVLPLIKAQTA